MQFVRTGSQESRLQYEAMIFYIAFHIHLDTEDRAIYIFTIDKEI
jgi:hypothetical protein